jgi:DNA-binding CsgD family transcriptional regulator/PAS domain-containing protein
LAQDDAIRLFYSAATGQAPWAQALDAMLAATGFTGSAVFVIDRPGRQAFDQNWHRLDPQYAFAYFNDYVPIDPRAARAFAPDGERVLYDALHTPEEEMDRHPFYAWMEQTQGMRYYLGGQSGHNGALPFTMTLHRSRDKGHASSDEIARFGQLFDHFEHALNMQYAIGLDATKAASQSADLEHADHGVILLDRFGHILQANLTARHIAERGDGLVLSSKGVSARSLADGAALQKRIAAALDGQAAKPLAMDRPFGGHPYLVTVFPVPQPGVLIHAGWVAACVRIFDPDRSAAVSLAKAAPLLGLTPRETQVLSALLEGAEPADIAALCGLRSATVRGHLSAIYKKTGINRQASLVVYAEALRRFLDIGK